MGDCGLRIGDCGILISHGPLFALTSYDAAGTHRHTQTIKNRYKVQDLGFRVRGIRDAMRLGALEGALRFRSTPFEEQPSGLLGKNLSTDLSANLFGGLRRIHRLTLRNRLNS